MRISDWSSDVCSSDLVEATPPDGSLRRKARRGRSPDLRRVVHAGDGTAGRVGGSRERGVPFDCNRRRARDRPAARHRARAGLAGKRFLEQAAVPVRLLRDRKSTRLTPVTNAHIVCRLLLEKKNKPTNTYL